MFLLWPSLLWLMFTFSVTGLENNCTCPCCCCNTNFNFLFGNVCCDSKGINGGGKGPDPGPGPGSDPDPSDPGPGSDPDPSDPDPGSDPDPSDPDPGPGSDPDPSDPDPDPSDPDPGSSDPDPGSSDPDPGSSDPDPGSADPDPGSSDPDPSSESTPRPTTTTTTAKPVYECVRMTVSGNQFQNLYQVSDLPKSPGSDVELNFTATGHEVHVIFSEQPVLNITSATLAIAISLISQKLPNTIFIYFNGKEAASRDGCEITGKGCQYYSISITGKAVIVRIKQQRKPFVSVYLPTLDSKKIVYFGLASNTNYTNDVCFLCETCVC